MAGQKQKRRLKKGFHAGGCRHSFCGNATGAFREPFCFFLGLGCCFSSIQAGSMPAF
ncbi:hypothetical protein ABER83_20825 [Bacillus subtilis]